MTILYGNNATNGNITCAEPEDVIRKAYEDALRNPHMRFVVYEDGESGSLYTFEDVAGGNSEPERAWRGEDSLVAEFCYQCWSPEDGDEYFRQNLLSYLDEGEAEQVAAEEAEREEELPGYEIKEMFPARYTEYCEGVLSEMLSDFRAADYL